MIRMIFLAIATFSAGFGLGYVKFFLLGDISQDYSTVDKNWIIQLVASALLVGPFLTCIIAAATASAFKKRNILAYSSLITAIFILVGVYTNWYGSHWFYLLIIGICFGFFNPAKNAAIPIQAEHEHSSTELLNAILNAAYILGLLGGVPVGANMAVTNPALGGHILYMLFLVSAVTGYMWYQDNEAPHLRPFKEASCTLIHETKFMLRKYFKFIASSSLLWGVSAVVSLAVAAYGEVIGLGDSVECSFLVAYPVIGIILGGLTTPILVGIRTKVVPFSCFMMSLLIWGIPYTCDYFLKIGYSHDNVYWILSGLLAVIGFFFGITTNLVEGEYLRRIYANKLEGTGAALLSAGTALIPMVLGLLTALCLIENYLSPETQFTLIAAASIICGVICCSVFCVDGDSWLARRTANVLRFILRLRYNIEIDGLDKVKEAGATTGTIFIPNHPSETDPVILSTEIWRIAPVRPVITERFYKMPIIKQVMLIVNAIPMQNQHSGSGYEAMKHAIINLKKASDALNRGENVLFYPSGRVMLTGLEQLGNNSGLQRVLQKAPNAKIVLVRTRGLFGSMYSSIWTGDTPLFLNLMKLSIKALIKNWIFFLPRRHVKIHFEMAPADFPIHGSVQELNSYIEEWLNRDGEEPVTIIPYTRSGKDEILDALKKEAANLQGGKEFSTDNLENKSVGAGGTL